ncbi:MAG TPA: GNAT family N-acetyltransferase [Devosiaceae bacterium]|jgi:GNAT superfamily N-acetyltransferase
MLLDMGDGFTLREARATDQGGLSAIALQTGDRGGDATAREDDPELFGVIYALPYQVIEPGFSFVLDHPQHGLCGYALAAPATNRFYTIMEEVWYKPLRLKLRDPGEDRTLWQGSDWARYAIHHPQYHFSRELYAFPARLQLQLLPQARGCGLGEKCLHFLMGQLAVAKVGGVHVQIDAASLCRQAFFEHLGFLQVVGDNLPQDITFMARELG